MKKEEIYAAIGKTLAPVEIDSNEAMEMFGITKKDLIPLLVGTKRIMVYPYPAQEEVCREMMRDLRRRYVDESRNNRCMIAGTNGGIKVCPEKYSCSDCPVEQEQRQSRQASLDFLLDEGLEVEDTSNSLSQIEVDLFLEYLEKQDPINARILVLKCRGYTETEIGQMLHLPCHVVKYSRRKIRELAIRYFGKGVVR